MGRSKGYPKRYHAGRLEIKIVPSVYIIIFIFYKICVLQFLFLYKCRL